MDVALIGPEVDLTYDYEVGIGHLCITYNQRAVEELEV